MIKFHGTLLPEAEQFTIDLTEQIAAGRVFLHLKAQFHVIRDKKHTISVNKLVSNEWQKDTIIDVSESFEFRPGNEFNLFVYVFDDFFVFLLPNNVSGIYKRDLNVSKANFMRVHGDVVMKTVQIARTELVENAVVILPTPGFVLDDPKYALFTLPDGFIENDSVSKPGRDSNSTENILKPKSDWDLVNGRALIVLVIIGISLVVAVTLCIISVRNKNKQAYGEVDVIYGKDH